MNEESLGFSSVLPVAEESDSTYELELPPTNGLDYLRRVRLEAEACPGTVTVELELPAQAQKLCSNDRQLSRSSAISARHLVPLCSPAPSGYAPSVDWQRKQVSLFSQTRMRLSQEIQKRRKNRSSSAIKLPAADNVQGWCRLCFGKFHSKLKNLEAGGDDGVSQSEQAGAEISQSEDLVSASSPSPPLLSIISSIDQEMLLSVLEYHIYWFEVTGFTTHQGQWFYALLAALEKPLLPESCSLIRSLARVSSNLRASLASADDVLLPHLNLLICIVGRYFEQTDMADNDPT